MCYIVSMNTRFFHAKIMPFTGAPLISDGELHVCGDRIAYVGAESPQSDVAFDREIDCHGDLLLPGFKNAHTHSAMTFLRSKADDLPLQDWLYNVCFPAERKLTAEMSYVFTKLAILEYLTSGITAQMDMYMFRDAVAQAAVDTGFRTVIINAVNDFGGTAQELIDESERFSRMGPLVSFEFSCHAEYTTSDKLMHEIADVVRQEKRPFYIHMNETAAEVTGCVERHGQRPFVYLDSLGLFDFGGGGYHCVHVSEEEMDIIKNRGVYVVTCPGSNTKLASGVAPVYEYLARGIPVAIGTDGPASNNCLDMFREMFLVTGLQKLRHGANAVDALTVLQMACKVGAHAMRLPDCDSLAPGKQADIIRIDLTQPNMQPENNVLKNVVYSGSKKDVKMTMVAGRILYEDGTFFIGEEPARIYSEANRLLRAFA